MSTAFAGAKDALLRNLMASVEVKTTWGAKLLGVIMVSLFIYICGISAIFRNYIWSYMGYKPHRFGSQDVPVVDGVENPHPGSSLTF